MATSASMGCGATTANRAAATRPATTIVYPTPDVEILLGADELDAGALDAIVEAHAEAITPSQALRIARHPAISSASLARLALAKAFLDPVLPEGLACPDSPPLGVPAALRSAGGRAELAAGIAEGWEHGAGELAAVIDEMAPSCPPTLA